MKISFVICTYNRSSFLKTCLDSLLDSIDRSNIDLKYEVLIVNNNSTDNTSDIISSYSGIREVFEDNQGLAYARNRGVRESTGNWVVFVDDDGIPRKDFFSVLVNSIMTSSNTISIIGGTYIGYSNIAKPRWMNSRMETNYFLSEESRELKSFKEYVSGGIMAVRRELFSSIGLFSVDLGMKGETVGYGEETEFQNRAYDHNKSIFFCKEWQMDHYISHNKMTLIWRLKKSYAIGRDSFEVCREKINIAEVRRDTYYEFKKLLKSCLKKVFNNKDYYVENLMLDLGHLLLSRLGKIKEARKNERK